MLKHQQAVLNGVRSNRNLFKKELIKSLKWLNKNDLSHFIIWVTDNFYREYSEIIMDVFKEQKYQYSAINQ